MIDRPRPAPRLALYGLAFRTLRALWAGGGRTALHVPGSSARPAHAFAPHGACPQPQRLGLKPVPGRPPRQEA